MDETRTRFCAAIPASRRASSKEVRRSLCLPTPFVKNKRFGTMLFPNSYSSVESVAPLHFDADKDNTAHVRNVHSAVSTLESDFWTQGDCGARVIHKVNGPQKKTEPYSSF